MTLVRLSLGKRGEAFAEAFLRRRGYKVLERNYRTAVGEIDLIAMDGGTLVFVEVKTRTSAAYGQPQEAVDQRKQRQIIRTAEYYMAEKRMADRPARIDVLSIRVDGEEMSAEQIENAFEMPS